MKLEKFKETDKKKIGIIVFTVSCVLLIAGVFLYKTFALFEVKDNLNSIEGSVQDLGDLYFTFYVNDQIRATMPSKESGQFYDETKSSCTNGATPEFNVEDWSIKVKNFTQSRTKCTLYFRSAYQEVLLNGTDPVVTGSLIPVVIEPDGTVKKADTNSKWYSYEEKQWANAIILNDESVRYQNGEVIPESNIESYFVWIPRYKYQIFNTGEYSSRTTVENKVQTIQVVFENKDTPISNGSTVGSWLTHPAFTAFNSNGMWVGKFETGKKSGSDNVRNGEQVQIKPNISSWRSIQVANAFYTTYDYKRELDSHMMKNTEWGAVAYLQHSAYGSQASVRINNNSSYITGYSANNEPTCGYTGTNESCNIYCNNGSCNQAYNTSTGYLASTTGNISGIYDMSGGAWEYVMGVMLDSNGKPMSGQNSTYHSGFKGSYGEGGSNTNGYEWSDRKYYDTYTYSTSDQDFSRRILGDATGEIGPFGYTIFSSQTRSVGSWYTDYAQFIHSGGPWFLRSTDFSSGIYTGVFAFGFTYGSVSSAVSFRVVLTP